MRFFLSVEKVCFRVCMFFLTLFNAFNDTLLLVLSNNNVCFFVYFHVYFNIVWNTALLQRVFDLPRFSVASVSLLNSTQSCTKIARLLQNILIMCFFFFFFFVKGGRGQAYLFFLSVLCLSTRARKIT